MATAGRHFLILILLSSEAFASPSAVFIRSRVCGTDQGISSSGVLLKFMGKPYVLTSPWGILEEGTGICHEVKDPITHQVHPAKLAALDWGAGFALLETPELVPTEDLESFTGFVPSASSETVQGFEEGTLLEKKARIIAAKSTRHHLPSLPFSFELISDRISNAYVGAPVYGKTLDGIVSSQWIEIVPGAHARIREWKTESNERPNQFFVVPIGLIRQRLAAGLPLRTSFQATAAKLKNRNAIYFGKFFFESECPEGAGLPPVDGIGPIGGAEGVGTGGVTAGMESCKIGINAQGDVSLQAPDFFPKDFAKDLETNIKKGLFIPFLGTRNAGGYIDRVSYFSTHDFFTELVREKRQWILMEKNPPPGMGTSAFEQLRRENIRFKEVLEKAYPLIKAREDDRKDFRFLYTHSMIVESLNWKFMERKDWLSVTSRTFANDFVQGVEYEGKNLRLILKESAEKMESLFQELGG